MSDEKSEKQAKKEALKALRKKRGSLVAAASARVKAQKKAVKSIREALNDSNATIPEIAEAAGLPTDATLWYVMALKKYGEVLEKEKSGDYFTYGLAET
ncbi:MAG: hypothetical protein R6V54_06435 [Desulfobacteraceae bacterium]